MVPASTLYWWWHLLQSYRGRLKIAVASFDRQRGQMGPAGQRSFSRTARQRSSVPNLLMRPGRSISAAIGVSMPRKKKHPREMTTDELARHVFHPHVLKHVKRALKGAPKGRKRKD